MSKIADVYVDLIERITDDKNTQEYLLDNCDKLGEMLSPETLEYLAQGGRLNKLESL